jgi:hypothetical protein
MNALILATFAQFSQLELTNQPDGARWVLKRTLRPKSPF